MTKVKEPVEQLNEIRNMMERSSRFISLSGLSGIFAGIFAIIGAGIAFWYLRFDIRYFDAQKYFSHGVYESIDHKWIFLVTDAMITLILALLAAAYFTSRRAKAKGQRVWDYTAKRMIINLFIPLVAGGIFCLALFMYHIVFLIAPATLIFYGLALLNTSKYTLPEIRVLGVSEIILGLIACFLVNYGLLFWAFGFGILHIFYGAMMFYRYEKNEL